MSGVQPRWNLVSASLGSELRLRKALGNQSFRKLSLLQEASSDLSAQIGLSLFCFPLAFRAEARFNR